MAVGIVVPTSLRIGQYLSMILGFGLSTFAVGARVYTKLRISSKFLLEDYFSVAAWLSFLAFIGLAIVIGKNGGEAIHVAYLSSIERVIYDPIMVFVKTSILLQYITLFVARRGNAFHWAVHILLWINVIFYTIITFLHIFQCTPRERQWNPSVPGHCLNKHHAGVSSGTINAVSDFIILLLPLPIIWHLQLSLEKKLRLFAIFGFGSCACIASVIRLIYSINTTDVPGNVEYQLDVNRQGLWAFAEIAIGIIVGCLPTLPKFFKHLVSVMPTLPSSLKIFSSGSSQSSRRKFFRKSATSETNTNITTGSSRTGLRNQIFGSRAPYIESLHFTRNSFFSASRDPSRMVLPIHNDDNNNINNDRRSLPMSKSTSSPERMSDDRTWYSGNSTPTANSKEGGDRRQENLDSISTTRCT